MTLTKESSDTGFPIESRVSVLLDTPASSARSAWVMFRARRISSSLAPSASMMASLRG